MNRIGAWMAFSFMATAFCTYEIWRLSGREQAATWLSAGPAISQAAHSGKSVDAPQTSRAPVLSPPARSSEATRSPRAAPKADDLPAASATWLIVGSDSRKGEPARSDALLLARVQQQAAKVYVLSIPRDMRVAVRGHGYTKINHALAYGGMPLLKETVQQALGVPIDHTLAINFHGFTELINALGGVTVYVDKPLRYDDATDQTHIRLEKGWQHLDGKQALDYVRFRHDALADTGRMQRQQQLLSALAHEHVPPSRWRGVIAAAFQLPNDVRTDASFWEMFTTAAHLARAQQISVISRTLKGVNQVDPQDGLWYFYVDPHQPQAVRGELSLFDHGH